ncbi:MAG: class I SAM-dependent methyltransferase [Acidimicrobiales bacterium]
MSSAIYDEIGTLYAKYRRPDPRIRAQIEAALGDAKSVLNVGAGTGSYEPSDRYVVAVEPSEVMLAQRRSGSAQAVRSVGESLPFASGSFDAALAVLTLHHWKSQRVGLREMARVARRVVILHFDQTVHGRFWVFTDYLPECNDLSTARTLAPEEVAAEITATRTEIVPVPSDCIDGFNWAYWKRPDRYLESDVRACISTFALLSDDLVETRMEMLRRDLDDGTWRRRHGHLLALDTVDAGLRLVIRE